jgi:small subunit ribosomal protein S17
MTETTSVTAGRDVADDSSDTASRDTATRDTATRDTATRDTASRNFRKTREGLVVSDKMDKTVVVAVEDRVQHPLYKKTLRRTNKLKAHDELNGCGVGDRVLLMETRPLSATKRWRVVEVLEKAK